MSDQHDDAAVWLAYAFRAGDAVAVGPAYLPPLLPFSPAQSRGFRADLGDTVNFQHDGAWAARFEANTSVSAPFEYARPAASALCGTSPEGFGPFAPLDVREDFTPCFEGTVLAAIPRTILLLYVALVGLAKVFSRSRNASERSNIVRTRDSWLWWAKMVGDVQRSAFRPLLFAL